MHETMIAYPSETDVKLTPRDQSDLISLILGRRHRRAVGGALVGLQLQWACGGRTLRTQALRLAMNGLPLRTKTALQTQPSYRCEF